MKKFLVTLILGMAFALNASAQEIFQEVKNLMDAYETVKNDTTQNLNARKLATFKFDAIYYLIYQANEDVTEIELGQQVDAMIEFTALYLKRLDKASKKEKPAIMKQFTEVTLNNPHYNDMDKETIYAYVDNPNFVTNFSLDTDWVKALEEVSR